MPRYDNIFLTDTVEPYTFSGTGRGPELRLPHIPNRQAHSNRLAQQLNDAQAQLTQSCNSYEHNRKARRLPRRGLKTPLFQLRIFRYTFLRHLSGKGNGGAKATFQIYLVHNTHIRTLDGFVDI